MRIVRHVDELRRALAVPRRAGQRIGLVPTMGAFHEGHLSLIRRARQQCDVVVVSVFVNPTQFNDQADLEGYPRDERRDAMLAAQHGVDYLYAPAVDEVYPHGFSTTVAVERLTQRLEGAHRGRGHFTGVTTVVTKLLNAVMPEVAYFGQKDAQQVLVIRQLVRDLDLPVRVEACPTVRERDGLAMSSRNALLSAQERRQALSLSRALRAAQEAIDGGERRAGAIRVRALGELSAAGVEPEYFELVSQDTLAPVEPVDVDGDVLAVVAARVGPTRLIDNATLIVTPVAATAA